MFLKVLSTDCVYKLVQPQNFKKLIEGRIRSFTVYQNSTNSRGANTFDPKIVSLLSKRLHQQSRTSFSSSTNQNSQTMTNEDVFKISDYDCIGFDLDNTLLRYKVSAMVQLEFDVLTQFMVTQKGYDSKHLQRPLSDQIDFLQKGLIVDFRRGNLLKVRSDGHILKATHGTVFMSDSEIEQIYGPERVWTEVELFTKDLLCAWNGPAANKLRTLLDYFDMPASLTFGRCIDTLDEAAGGRENITEYNVWPDILDGLLHMYTREHFASGNSEYFETLKQCPGDYMHVASDSLVAFLKQLKSKKTTFLLTGSNADFANLTAGYTLGADWRELFDVVVCFAKKPGFFDMQRPFVRLNENGLETETLAAEDMELNSTYSQGNWKDLMTVLATKSNSVTPPRVLYVGDNLLQDVYAPNCNTKCDTVAIVEEMLAEGLRDSTEVHPDHQLLTSSVWGSYFGHQSAPTLWSEVVRKHARICVANVDAFAKNPIDHEYSSFTKCVGCTDGFYPTEPKAFGCK